MRRLRITLIVTFSTACFVANRATKSDGVLHLTIVDGAANSITPARVMLRNDDMHAKSDACVHRTSC